MKKLVALFLVISTFFFGRLYWNYTAGSKTFVGNKVQIVEYQEKKHKDFILDQFKQNWFWLIESPDYDVVAMLDEKKPNAYEPEYLGKMRIVVVQDLQKNLVGFGTYYMRSPGIGDILFVEIDKQYRGKRYAQELVEYMLDDLKKMGAKYVKLSTRIENEKARKLYTRLGFNLTGQSKTMVHFRKKV